MDKPTVPNRLLIVLGVIILLEIGALMAGRTLLEFGLTTYREYKANHSSSSYPENRSGSSLQSPSPPWTKDTMLSTGYGGDSVRLEVMEGHSEIK